MSCFRFAFSCFALPLLITAGFAWSISTVQAQDWCQVQCQQNAYDKCTDAHCDPMVAGCGWWCGAHYMGPGCLNSCRELGSGDACAVQAMEMMTNCEAQSCWTIGGPVTNREPCMKQCAANALAFAEACRNGSGGGGAIPPATGAGSTAGPDSQTVSYIESGRPFQVVLDHTADKFDDSSYTGDYRTDPLGNVQGGKTYVCSYAGGSFTCTGYNEGTRECMTWTADNASLSRGEISLWGIPLAVDSGGAVFSNQFGRVGTIRLGHSGDVPPQTAVQGPPPSNPPPGNRLPPATTRPGGTGQTDGPACTAEIRSEIARLKGLNASQRPGSGSIGIVMMGRVSSCSESYKQCDDRARRTYDACPVGPDGTYSACIAQWHRDQLQCADEEIDCNARSFGCR